MKIGNPIIFTTGVPQGSVLGLWAIHVDEKVLFYPTSPRDPLVSIKIAQLIYRIREYAYISQK